MGFSNNILQIYNPAIFYCHTAPNTASSQHLKQIKYKMLVLVQSQSAENVRL